MDPITQVKGTKNNILFKIFKEHFPKTGLILEGGSGNGQWVKVLNDEGYRIIGMDYAGKTINKLQYIFPELNFVIGDLAYQCYKDDSFVGHLSRGVIEHFELGPTMLIREINRTLQKNGILIVTTPYFNILKRIKYFFRNTKGKGQFYQYHFTKKELFSFFCEKYSLIRIFYFNPYKTLEDELRIKWIFNIARKLFKKDNKKDNEKKAVRFATSANVGYFSRFALAIGGNLLMTRLFGHSIGFVLKKRLS